MDFPNENKLLLHKPSRYVDEKEAAEVLGLRPHTLASWRSQRRGPVYSRYAGGGSRGSIRYNLEQLRLFAEAGRIEPEGGQLSRGRKS